MSLRGFNSRQIAPSFLRRRRSASPIARTRNGGSSQSSFERAANKRLSRSWSGRSTPGIPRPMPIMKRSSFVSIPPLSGHTLRASSGALRHVAALLSGLLSQSKFGSLLQNARLGTWEPGLLRGLRQRVTRPIREFKQRRLTMFLHNTHRICGERRHHPHRQ